MEYSVDNEVEKQLFDACKSKDEFEICSFLSKINEDLAIKYAKQPKQHLQLEESVKYIIVATSREAFKDETFCERFLTLVTRLLY